MKKTALLIMIITLFSKLLGFGRDIFLSYFFGASGITDAYLISLTIPSVIFGFIGIGIVTAYIPMQTKIVLEEGEEEGSKFTTNFTNAILVLTTIIFSFGLIFTENIVKIFALGFYGDTLMLSVEFTRISLFGMYFTALVSIFSGYLQIKKNYVIPALAGFPFNIIVIISIFFASKGNYKILAIGTLVASASQFIMLIPFIYKEKFKYSLYVNFNNDKLKRVLYIALPSVLGASANQINTLVDKTIASSISVGGISALNYADRLNIFIQSLFVLSIVTSMYPIISNYASINNIKGIKETIMEAISIISLVVIPITVGAIFFSKEIVTLLFGRGAFNEQAIVMTSLALFYYSFGMWGYGLREILSRGFYSIQDTKTPMLNATFGVVINIILNIILSKYMGVGGLALATSISGSITALLLYISLQKKIGYFQNRKLIISLIKVLIASFIMGTIAKKSFELMSNSMNFGFSLIASIFLGVLVYFIAIFIMKIEELNNIVTIFKNKIKKA